MALNKLKVSLIIVSLVALGFAAASFFVDTVPQVNSQVADGTASTVHLAIDFGDGEVKSFDFEPRGENLFILTRNKLSEEGIDVAYETFTGLGELITRIGDKRNGTGGKYWQFWVNGAYSQVGASSYIPRVGDVIEWKFTPSQQLR